MVYLVTGVAMISQLRKDFSFSALAEQISNGSLVVLPIQNTAKVLGMDYESIKLPSFIYNNRTKK